MKLLDTNTPMSEKMTETMSEKEFLKSEIEKAFVEWFEKGNITYCLNPEAEAIWLAARREENVKD